MPAKLLTATEAARNFSDVLDQVSHHGASYDIQRGREMVARLVPMRPLPNRITVADLSLLLQRLPSLAAGDGERFEKDISSSRKRLRAPRDPWL